IFLLAKTGESFYVVDKGLPIVRVHHREDGARLRQLLAQCGADRVRESMIDEDDPLLPHIINRNTTWQGIDDVLDKALAFGHRLNCFSVPIKEDAEDRTGESQAKCSG